MKRFIITLFIISCLFCSICYANFSDLKSSHWAYDTIILMQQKGYLNGYEDGTFKPDAEVTREEFAQMVLKAAPDKTVNVEQIENYFDVPSTRWSYKAVQLVGHSIKETSDGYVYFYPQKPIERQEVAKILSDFFDYKGEEVTEIKKFRDYDSIKEEYAVAVNNVYNANLMKGMSDDEFSPESSLNRAQAATLISRMIKIDEPVVEPQNYGEGIDTSFLKLENNGKNIIYSPLSIKNAMKMLSLGANGETKTEIDNLVGKYNLTKYNSSEKLSLANAIFIQDSFKGAVSDDYTNTLKNNYNAEVNYDSFTSAGPLNNWVEEKTLKLIKNMFSDDDVIGNQLILINALAIDMPWKYSIDGEKTRGREFTTEIGKTFMADTMEDVIEYSGSYKTSEITPRFLYYKDDEVQIASKDLAEFDGVNLEFVAIMPKNESVTSFTESISEEKLKSLYKKLENNANRDFKEGKATRAHLYFPKFKFEYDLKFKADLQALGMKRAFDGGLAEFSNISSKINFFVDDAKHKAMIEFSEKGIKAAAVTSFGMKATAFLQPIQYEEIYIEFNKPFLFVIKDKNTDELWFIGKVYEPLERK